jgi:2-polyprenyl-6-methoxyphenol hydroxylase-like FAD-dependent oxidoreductase
MITRTSDRGKAFPGGAVIFPRNCIKVLRNRPITSDHKVVNRWFDGRRILIGDAAHLLPPFGGLGIACGLQDAHQLAWRLAIIEHTPKIRQEKMKSLLDLWMAERRHMLDRAASFTMANGKLCTEPESMAFYIYRHVEKLVKTVPGVSRMLTPPDLGGKGSKASPMASSLHSSRAVARCRKFGFGIQ